MKIDKVIQDEIVSDIQDGLELLDYNHLWEVHVLAMAIIANMDAAKKDAKKDFAEEMVCNAEHLADCAEDR